MWDTGFLTEKRVTPLLSVPRSTLSCGSARMACGAPVPLFIDTGSPITIFDHGTAQALLVRFNHAGAETAQIAILGATRTVQFEYVELAIVADLSLHWTAHVGFITDPTFVMPFQGILGNDGFLDKWAVTFNKYYDYFSLVRPDEGSY